MSIRKNIQGTQTAGESLLHERHVMAYQIALDRVEAGWKVVEIGHGDGYGLNMLAQKVDIVGLDIDPSIVEYARKKYGKQYFQQYDGEHIPYDDHTFDAACMFQVIEHVVDDVTLMAEIRRVLKPGGFAILTTPNRVLRVPYGEKPWNIEHVREYYPEELEGVLKQAGYKQVEILGIDGSDEYRTVELRRVARARKLRRLDPFRWRRFMPDQLLYDIGRVIVRAQPTTPGPAPEGAFFVTDTDLYRSLDLVGIGTK